MKTSIRLSLSIVLAAAIAPLANAHVFTTTGEYLFDFGHINYAWGEQIWGFYIDKDGSVFSYERLHGDPRWKHDMAEMGSFWSLTSDELERKFTNRTFLGKVDAGVLDEKLALITPSSEGEIVRRNTGADGGQTNGNALLYDKYMDRYLLVNLGTPVGSFNDFEEKNTSEEAKSLLNWLSEINNTLVEPHKQFPYCLGSAVLLGDSLKEDSRWWHSPGFGYFSTINFPWIYHNQLGWLFWHYRPGNGLYLYDIEQGWFWTKWNALPYRYSFGQRDWIRTIDE